MMIRLCVAMLTQETVIAKAWEVAINFSVVAEPWLRAAAGNHLDGRLR